MGIRDSIKSRTYQVWAQAKREWPNSPRMQDKGLPAVTYDVRGTCAGKAYAAQHRVAFNLKLAEHVGLDAFDATITHEVAHLVTRYVYGPHVRPHGPEWQYVMVRLGAKPERCHSYDTSTVRVRKSRRTCKVVCGCREHAVTPLVYGRVLDGAPYRCPTCKGRVRPVVVAEAAS